MAKVAHGLMSVWKVFQVIHITDEKNRAPKERTWVPCWGVEIPWIYFLEWIKIHKISA